MSYQLTIEEHPAYLHARATGPRNPENALRFLREAHEACMASGKSALLLEMALAGPSLDRSDVFRVISQRSPDGSILRRIAYVDPATPDPERSKFAETVAVNRGVNVRLFPDIESAARWIAEA